MPFGSNGGAFTLKLNPVVRGENVLGVYSPAAIDTLVDVVDVEDVDPLR